MLVVEEGLLYKAPSPIPGAYWYHFSPGAKAYQKIPLKSFQKTLDNLIRLCYNKTIERA